MKTTVIKKALKATLPVMTGYLILGIGFGLSMKNNGYGLMMIFVMSLCIYAGSLQYVGINLISMQAGIINTFITSLAVNARHLFYGISMVDKYQNLKKHKIYPIFALTDETDSLLCEKEIDADYEDSCFYVSLFDHLYWVTGSVLGGIIAEILPFKIIGIDFSMTALFIATMVSQWKNADDHFYALTGLIVSAVALIVLGKDVFLIPSMILIMIIVTLYGKKSGDVR